MYLNNYKNRHELLVDWIIESTPKGYAILDIGANDGSFCPETHRVSPPCLKKPVFLMRASTAHLRFMYWSTSPTRRLS
jgi:hypothetical protein